MVMIMEHTAYSTGGRSHNINEICSSQLTVAQLRYMGLLTDTYMCGLRMRRVCREYFLATAG